MTPYYSDSWLTIFEGDARTVLAGLPAESVNCVVTSPPYWGLRDYGTATWEGGDPECDHRGGQRRQPQRDNSGGLVNNRLDSRGEQSWTDGATQEQFRDICGKCGARRIDAQLGLEPTPEAYVAAMVEVFREVRRVLRSDGTLWLNLGDSYAGSGPNTNADFNERNGHGSGQRKQEIAKTAVRGYVGNGLKPKDLVGVPWRVAFALQADGWYLRSDIIWSKPNPMPESVTDRPTKSHEYLFLLSKSARYYFDADAVREDGEPYRMKAPDGWDTSVGAGGHGSYHRNGRADGAMTDEIRSGRNLRTVWTVATSPYPGAHFATFPPKLVEPCIKAGTSEKGICPECGAPWERVLRREGGERYATGKSAAKNGAGLATAFSGYTDGSSAPTFITTGWRPTCKHDADPVPAVVLDCFAGTGTVGMVAQQLSRRAVLIDLNADYLRQCLARNAQTPMGLPA